MASNANDAKPRSLALARRSFGAAMQAGAGGEMIVLDSASTSGVDNASCSFTAPCRTIQRAGLLHLTWEEPL